jgi:hypothetical protein
MSDSGSTWWLGADRLWRKGQPPSGWHQTRDGLWHPPSTAAPNLKADATPASIRLGPRSATSPAEPSSAYDDEPLAEIRKETVFSTVYDDYYGGHDGDHHDGPAPADGHRDRWSEGDAVGGGDEADDVDVEGDEYADDYEYAYHDDGYTDADLDDEHQGAHLARARHMAGNRSSEMWSGLVDRVLSLPMWLRVAIPTSATVVLLGGIGLALAGGGGGQADQAEGGEEPSGFETAGPNEVSPSSTSSTVGTNSTAPSPSSSSTSSTATPPTSTQGSSPGAAPGDDPPSGGGGSTPTSQPPSTNPTSPPSTSPPPTSPPPATPDYSRCSPLERLIATDPDGDGIYCE